MIYRIGLLEVIALSVRSLAMNSLVRWIVLEKYDLTGQEANHAG